MRRRVVERAEDCGLVGVGHDHPLGAALERGVVVIGGTPEHARAFLDAHDPRERLPVARRVSDDADPVADDHPAPAQRPGPHGDHGPAVDGARVAAPVHGHDEAVLRFVVARPVARSGTGRRTRAYPDIVLVVVALPLRDQPSSMLAQSCGNSGIVLDVHATSVSTIPGTCSPTTAAAWAIRWSA